MNQTSLIPNPMRKVVVALTVMILLVVLIGADIRRTDTTETKTANVETKKKCYGYTIIEFGKGVNCNGDTIGLVRVDGIQRMQSELSSAE
jgi:hypothetical protein